MGRMCRFDLDGNKKTLYVGKDCEFGDYTHVVAMNNVKIGDNVWIGENAVILSGSKIGDGCVIGANSLVSKVIPTNSIVIGANKILRKY